MREQLERVRTKRKIVQHQDDEKVLIQRLIELRRVTLKKKKIAVDFTDSSNAGNMETIVEEEKQEETLRETTTELERIEEKEEIKEMYTESVLREDVKNNNAEEEAKVEEKVVINKNDLLIARLGPFINTPELLKKPVTSIEKIEDWEPLYHRYKPENISYIQKT